MKKLVLAGLAVLMLTATPVNAGNVFHYKCGPDKVFLSAPADPSVPTTWFKYTGSWFNSKRKDIELPRNLFLIEHYGSDNPEPFVDQMNGAKVYYRGKLCTAVV